jgi:hypothetical protein
MHHVEQVFLQAEEVVVVVVMYLLNIKNRQLHMKIKLFQLYEIVIVLMEHMYKIL